jgi:hypothetical protein
MYWRGRCFADEDIQKREKDGGNLHGGSTVCGFYRVGSYKSLE